MKQPATVALGIALAAFVMIEIYNAASGALLVIWLVNRENRKDVGFEPQRITVELEIFEQDNQPPNKTKPANHLSMSVGLQIDGETAHPEKRATGPIAASAVINPPLAGQPKYIVLLPEKLKKGDKLVVHLYQITPTTVASCGVRGTIIHPNRNNGRPQAIPEVRLSENEPAYSIDLQGINSANWSPEWQREQ